ncbi:MAG: helix-turn-helix domain-containing protein [Lachnospiraceae bacterium]|nr:helix-turn-helix domain-containing protein [Lachnospiraceae bacterium]
MKLSLSIVLAFCPEYEYDAQNTDLSAAYEGITLFDRDFSYIPNRHYLQLIPSQMLLKSLPGILNSPVMAQSTLLCACPDRSILPKGLPEEISIVFLYTQDSFRMVFNRLLHVFQLFENWDKTLHVLTLNRRPVQELLDSSDDFLRYPTLILDPDFSVIAHYQKSGQENDLISQIVNLGYVTPEMMSFLRKLGLFPASELSGTPVISHYELTEGQKYYSILYHYANANRTLAYALIFHCGNDPREEYIHQTNILSENLELYFRQESNFHQFSQETYESFLGKILDHPKQINHRQLEDQIKNIPDIRMDGQFLLARTDWSDTDNHGKSFSCWNLKNSGLGLKPFIYRNTLYVLRDISNRRGSCAFLTPDEKPLFEECFQRHTFTCAISNAFFSLTDLPLAVTQCEKALQLHETERENANTYVRFEDISIQYLVSELENSAVLNLITSPGYQKLRQYDTEHHSDLRGIFMQYLQNKRNINQTAAATYLHRNTVLNKIKLAISVMQDECDSYQSITAFIISYLKENKRS